MKIFVPSDILIPKVKNFQKWSVVACDQFTSQPEYWEEVACYVGDDPSSLNLVLPEVKLNGNYEQEIEHIHQNMNHYLENELFQEYTHSFVYVERTLLNGKIRRGIIGMVDLEEYDYSKDSTSSIRATEATVEERIPPRKKVRQEASLELPHVILLFNDLQDELMKSIETHKDHFQKLYDFDLMKNGGHVTGWLITDKDVEALSYEIEKYENRIREKYAHITDTPVLFAVGDGNHSLATAKACYEDVKKKHPEIDYKNLPIRYALVELENIHEPSLEFEPIHRIVQNVDIDALLNYLSKRSKPNGYKIEWLTADKHGSISLDMSLGNLAVEVLQSVLDEYLRDNAGNIDYIHGEDVVKKLAKEPNSIGFLLPNIDKDGLFSSVVSNGALPRKTFSMGHAQEKRYYMEARKI